MFINDMHAAYLYGLLTHEQIHSLPGELRANFGNLIDPPQIIGKRRVRGNLTPPTEQQIEIRQEIEKGMLLGDD